MYNEQRVLVVHEQIITCTTGTCNKRGGGINQQSNGRSRVWNNPGTSCTCSIFLQKELLSNGFPPIKKRMIKKTFCASGSQMILIGFDQIHSRYLNSLLLIKRMSVWSKLCAKHKIRPMRSEQQTKWSDDVVFLRDARYFIPITPIKPYTGTSQLK